jgi:hypothetical protein
MFTVQNLVIAFCIVLLVWYFAGALINRRRAVHLIAAIRDAARGVGQKPTIAWYGRSAFQLDFTEPATPLTGLRVLCLLEPRDFALAWVWNRLRGRRDLVNVSAVYSRGPEPEAQHPVADYGIAGLTSLAVQAKAPQVLMALQVGTGNEGAIRQGLQLLLELPGAKR